MKITLKISELPRWNSIAIIGKERIMSEETEYLPTGKAPDLKAKNLDEIENQIEGIEEKMGLSDAVEVENLSEDLISQMKNAKMSTMFRFFLGDKVKNRHDERGYIEMCGLDFRGDIYLVNITKNARVWYTPMELTIDEDDIRPPKHPPIKPKTDIPQD